MTFSFITLVDNQPEYGLYYRIGHGYLYGHVLIACYSYSYVPIAKFYLYTHEEKFISTEDLVYQQCYGYSYGGATAKWKICVKNFSWLVTGQNSILEPLVWQFITITISPLNLEPSLLPYIAASYATQKSFIDNEEQRKQNWTVNLGIMLTQVKYS